jgi:hypothetical protein
MVTVSITTGGAAQAGATLTPLDAQITSTAIEM